MIYSIVDAIVIPGKWSAFSEIFDKELVPILSKNGPKLVGAFHGYTGNMNENYALLAYDDLAVMQKVGQTNRNDKDYQRVNAKLAELLVSQTRTLLEPNPWSPLK